MKHLVALAVALAVTACPGPIAPLRPGDVPCAKDQHCPDLYACRFPGVDTRAICTWVGPSDDYARRLDAGGDR